MSGTEVTPLPESEIERLREMFDRSPVALTLADALQDDAPLIVANRAFLDLTGYSRSEVIGRNCRFLQSDLDNETQRAAIRDSMQHHAQREVVLRNRRKDGTVFDNMLFLNTLVDRNGQARFFLGSQFLLERQTTPMQIDRHIHFLDAAAERALEATHLLRAEQRLTLANAAHAVASAWLTLRS
ncbi:MAG: PAS domain-containing protein [Pseudomonadota bacterium]